MKKLYRPLVALVAVVLVVVFAGCGTLRPAAILASSDAAPLQGGGGSVVVNGQVQEGVVVVGTGSASAEPQMAEVGFGVELRGDNPDALVSEAAQKMDAAMAAAREFGILEEKTRTLNYNLWVETVQNPETGLPTGDVIYHLSHQVQVTTSNLDQIGELLAAVVNAGANAVNGVNFTIEDPDALMEQARDAAIADAQARAEHMAGQLGIGLGKPVLVTEGGSYPLYDRGIGGGAMMAEQAAPSLTPGSFSVSVSVQIVYAIR